MMLVTLVSKVSECTAQYVAFVVGRGTFNWEILFTWDLWLIFLRQICVKDRKFLGQINI